MRDPEVSGEAPSLAPPPLHPPDGSVSGSEPAQNPASDAPASEPPVQAAVPSVAPRSVRPSVPRMRFEGLPAVGIGIRIKLIGLTVATIVGIVIAIATYFVNRQIDDLRTARRDRAEVYAELAAHQLKSSIAFSDEETAQIGRAHV